MFDNHGYGTLIHANEIRQHPPGQTEGRARNQILTRRGVEGQELLGGPGSIERRRDDYFIFEIDKNPVACVALHVYPEENQGELACLFVRPPRESRHRAQADSVRGEPGPRDGIARAAGAVHTGVHVFPVEGEIRRGHS